MRNYIKIINVIVITLLIALIVGIPWIATSMLTPPDKEEMEKCFQQDKDELIIIVDYLSNLDYSFISIDRNSLKNGVMFTGASTRYQIIDDKTALDSLKKLLNTRKYIVIGKNENTVFFQKWNFLEKDRGIAVPTVKEDPPFVEFITKSEDLSEIGWYYYEADYEKYRKERGDKGTVCVNPNGDKWTVEPSPCL